jgi:2,4-dienoyl-CoA reductase-like NADH-dependent reductase (Old Yellow Enzyme family)
MAGRTPLAPSAVGRDPVNFVKPKAMSESEIRDTVRAFGAAASRAVEAGADAVQIHGAHGFLISEFLSPFFNVRTDAYGGTDENRFRFLKEVFLEVKANVPAGYPVLVKINADDHTPTPGVTPAIAAAYAGWLAALGIDGVEVSCGTSLYSFMNLCRGDVPTYELVSVLPWWKKPVGRIMIGKLEGKYDLEEGYNLPAAKRIKASLGSVPLLLVGGMRSIDHMEQVINEGNADFISMSRPFIRDPYLVRKLRDGKIDTVSCVSCNRCLAAVAGEIPVLCYNKKFPV